MNPGDFLKDLKLDSWYKALVYVGGVVLLLSLFVPVQGIAPMRVQAMSLGGMLFGLGVWKCQKHESFIKPPNVYTGPTALITITRWYPDPIGLMLNLAGVVSFSLGFFGVVR
jgi:hypothetical protein